MFIASMVDQVFQRPLVIELKYGKYRYVTSVGDAAQVLRRDWPETKGIKHAAAVKAVLASLDGKKPPSYARRAVLAAAKEAKILAPEDICDQMDSLLKAAARKPKDPS